MSRKGSVIRKYAVITYFAIVGNMRISHDKAVIAYLCFILISGTSVYGNAFADGGIVTNNGQSFFALKFQILWNSRDNRAGKYPAILAYPRPFHNGDIGGYPRAFTNFHILMNGCKWINFYIWSY